MDENLYTNESVWSLSFFYPDPQEDKKKKKKVNTRGRFRPVPSRSRSYHIFPTRPYRAYFGFILSQKRIVRT